MVAVAFPALRPRRRGLALVRVSDEKDGSTSPENQTYAIETFAASEGIDITGWIVGAEDSKYSGSRDDSLWWAKLDEGIEAIERGDADVLLVWRFSRAARHRLKWAIAIDRVESAGGALLAALERVEDTPSGRFTRGIHAEVNAYQAEVIGETWRETHERRRRAGKPPTGGPRFGYVEVKAERPDGRLVTIGYEPDPITGPLLTDLYRRYLGGMGAAQLTRVANDAAVRTSMWTYQGMLAVLDSGFAAGLIGGPHVKIGGKKVRVPVWERKYLPGVHEPLITTDTWEAYVARRRARSRQPTRTARKYLLTGLVRCGDCGGPMSGKTFNGRPTYICSRSTMTNVVRRVSMVAWRVDQIVEQWVMSLAEDFAARTTAVEGQRAKVVHSERVRTDIRAQIERADARLITLGLKLADGTLTSDEYTLIAGAVRDEKSALERRHQLASVNPVEHDAPAELTADLVKLWPDMTAEAKSLIIRPLLEAAVIYPAPHRGSTDRHVELIPRWKV